MLIRPTRLAAHLALAFGSGLLLQGTALAQASLERVEITGSSIKRVDAETALPVTVLTKKDIEKVGAVNTEQLLQSITASSSMGSTIGATGAGSSTYGFSGISLRGLDEERTLVLVNGRRLAGYAGAGGTAVNVNAIPLAAIERIEVLKDGASAIYGSDAVAGVVNFILAKNVKSFDISATMAKPTRNGGGGSDRVQFTGGWGDISTDKFNLTVSASIEREKALFAKDRSFAATGNQPPYLVSAATGQGNIEGGFTPGSFVLTDTDNDPATPPVPVWNEGTRQAGFGNSPGTGYGNPLAATDNCAQINMFKFPDPTTKGAPYCQFDSNAFVGLVPKRDLTTLSANFEAKLDGSMSLFGDALYSRSIVTQTIQTSPLRRNFMNTDALFQEQAVDPVLLIRPGNPAYDNIAAPYLQANGFGSLVGQPLAVTARVFDFGPRTSKDTSTQTRLVGGLRGNLGDTSDWEAAATYNESKLSGTVPAGYFSMVKFAKVVQDNDYNPWSLTQSDAFNAALAASGAAYTGKTLDARSSATSVDARLRGDLLELPAGMSRYALGGQMRKERLVTSPSPALETGDIAGLGGSVPPVNKDRFVDSLFSELEVPLLKGIDGNVSLRYDNYDDVGKSTTYKTGLRFQPNQNVAFRASVGTGFRAPTLTDLWQPQTLGSSAQFNDPATNQTDLQVTALTGGNPGLKPEKSRQHSVGMVLNPSKNTFVSVDLFSIFVRDILATPSAQEVVSRFRAGDPAFAGLVTLNANDEVDSIIQTLQNVGTAKVRGLDIEGRTRVNVGVGMLDLSINGTYFLQYDQTSPGGALSKKVGTTVEPDADGTPVIGADSGGVVLRWRHALTGSMTMGDFTWSLTQNYTTKYEDGHDLNGNRHFVPAYSIYDAYVSYNGIKNVRLALGVKNLLDKDPPIYIPVSNQFQAGYDVNQYDPRGRVLSLTAGFKF
jgi:iron complex outermembrane receptor protein